MIEVVIAENPLEPDTWEEYHVESVYELLASKFGQLPATAKIYHSIVCEANDITPMCEADIEKLEAHPGPLYVLVMPADPIFTPYIIAAVVAAVITVAVLVSIPKPPSSSTQSAPSPNNGLTDRQNTARAFARVPDIYGTVRSTPDLIMQPFTVFENNVEVEHAYMCVGRGYYEIHDVLDGTTPLRTIPGAFAVVYHPNSSPNTIGPVVVPPGVPYVGDGHNIIVGSGATGPVLNVKRINSVNGQTLFARNDDEAPITAIQGTRTNSSTDINPHFDSVTGDFYVSFASTTNPALDPTQLGFASGDSVYLGGGTFYDGEHIQFFLGGTYLIDWSAGGVTSSRIYLSNALAVNSDWGNVTALAGCSYPFSVARVVDGGEQALNTFLIPDPDTAEVWCNFVAPNGMFYVDDDGDYHAVTATIQMNRAPCDAAGNVTGAWQYITVDMEGNENQESIGITLKMRLPTPGRYLIACSRITLSPEGDHITQVVDKVQWRDMYAVGDTAVQNFGDVTTVYTVTQATPGALAVKQRKLNMLVTRMLPIYQGGSTFGPTYASTNSAADAIASAALDVLIGNRTVAEVDFAQIYSTIAVVNGYFGTTEAGQFCATLDDDNLSFEETVQLMAGAAFCSAYRQGNVIRLKFEQATEDSVLLFNHRNKVPASEKRTVTFGSNADYDSVEFTYTNPTDDARVVLYAPTRGVNAQKVDSVGCRSYAQAYFAVWRAWNKLKYGNTQVTFDAMQEATLLARADRILVADNTRSGTQDGEVVAINVLEYQLSQKVAFVAGHSYMMFLQGIDGTVDAIPVSPGSTAYNVILQRAPIVTLSTNPNASVRPLYWIVANDDAASKPQAFLVQEREPATSFTENVKAINYDARYYSNDDDYKLGSIPSNPYL